MYYQDTDNRLYYQDTDYRLYYQDADNRLYYQDTDNRLCTTRIRTTGYVLPGYGLKATYY